jgi:hypothetical protein
VTLASDLASRLGVSLGAPLEALVKLRVRSYLLELGEEAWSWADVPHLEEQHGFIVVGKTENGFFGPRRSSIKRSASTAQWVYADRQRLDPERVGQLVDFLSLWCFVPEFFTLHDKSAEDLEREHQDFFEANADVKRLVKRVLAIRGVRRLSGGEDAAQLVARVGGLLRPLIPAFLEPLDPPSASTAGDDEPGQDFEVTKARIREIERKALAKLRSRRN